MRSRTSDWFETKVRYDKTQEDGTQKRVTENYIVDALSFTEAEQTITKEMSAYISGDYKVTNITPTAFHEIFFMNDGELVLENEIKKQQVAIQKGDKKLSDSPVNWNNTDARWYKAVLAFITIDEKTEKEKRSNVTYLVQAPTLPSAVSAIKLVMTGTMIDYQIIEVKETNIIDVFEHDVNPKTGKKEDHKQ